MSDPECSSRIGRGQVLTVKEAAAIARVSPATIRRWCRLGHLHAFQVGRGAAIRIPAEELCELMARLGP
jgi:excisionase family DNA binding protein